jgi:hypothetical protein
MHFLFFISSWDGCVADAVRETVVPLVEAVSNKTTLFCHWGLLDGFFFNARWIWEG